MKLNRISLNTIGLNRIGLNRIGSPSRGSSSGSDRPYIAPEVLASLVAVVKCDGKSNNDPDRAIIKNLVDPDNPFVISNAAYKLNSGFGKYEEDFSIWNAKSNGGVKFSSDGTKIETLANNFSCQYEYSSIGRDVPSFKVKISNFTEGTISYYYRDEDGNEKQVRFGPITVANSKGIIELPKSYNTVENGTGYRGGFTSIQNTNIGLTIEQIPSFQGALVTDGVDDLIVSQKSAQEMLGGSNEITVVSMINTIVPNTEQLSYTNAFPINGVNVTPLRNKVSYTGKTGIYGYTYKNNAVSVVNNILGDKNDYEAAIAGEPQVDDRFEVTRLKFNSSVAWYWTFIAKRALTSDEINQIIAYYNLDKYVKPDIYYDVKKQGLSNDTPDTDWYLKDFSGNGRDMQLYNYGKTPESGINEEGGLQSDGVTDYGQYIGDLGLKDYTVAVDRAYPSLKSNGVPVIAGINSDTATPFLFEFADNTSVVRPYSFGATTVLSPMELSRKISYQSTYIYDGTAINKGLHDNTGNGLTIGRFGIDTQYANIALWSFLLFPYTLSEFLLERQLKRYKLGTLYPDMVEFRPIVKSNVPYDEIVFHNSSNIELQVGNYYTIGSQITIYIRLSSNPSDEIKEITLNGIPAFFVAVSSDNVYQYRANLNSKSPQKIDITIDEYIRYEDIVQPYPFIIPIIDTDGKEYTYGDKIKVGTEIRGGINGDNLLPELYKLNGYFNFNGAYFSASNKHVIGKTNVFELTNAPTYLKANEPNCIADPQRLRIPNSSYKILGYIPDISGHGNHLKINNSAYAGMSGANGYKYDWNTWSIVGGSNVERTDSLFTNKLAITTPTWGLLPPRNTVTDTFKIKVEGLKTGNIYWTYRESEETYKKFYIYNDGEYELPAPISESDGTGFIFNTGTNAGVIVRQIGQYEGSFCLDGVEDYLTIPTLSHGAKQVLMKVRSFKPVCTIYEQRTPTGVDGGWIPTFCIFMNNQAIAYVDGNNGNTYIDGILNTSIQGKQLVDITHNITVTNENTKFGNTQSPLIGKLATSNTLYAQMALFAFMSFDDISSEEEIKELNDIVGIEGGYVESPDYYWDAYGKSNMAALDIDYQDLFQSGNANKMLIDKSKAGLAALELYHNSGNNSELINRRLVANNFAYNEESGYNGWLGIGNLTNSFNESYVTSSWKRGGTFIKNRSANGSAIGYTLANWYDATNHILKFKIKITGLADNDTLYIRQYNVTPITSQQLFNGINDVTLDLSASPNPTYRYISFNYSLLTNDVDFEFLYEYQNGLVSDGVDDELKNEHMPVLTDYTWIMKRKRLNDNISTLCHKGDGVNNAAFLFEYIEGGQYTRSFSASGTLVKFPDLISYQTKNSYNGKKPLLGNQVDGNQLRIFMGSDFYPRYTKAVFYKAMLYSKTIDQLSINMLKNLFEKDELIDVNNPIFKK